MSTKSTLMVTFYRILRMYARCTYFYILLFFYGHTMYLFLYFNLNWSLYTVVSFHHNHYHTVDDGEAAVSQ